MQYSTIRNLLYNCTAYLSTCMSVLDVSYPWHLQSAGDRCRYKYATSAVCVALHCSSISFQDPLLASQLKPAAQQGLRSYRSIHIISCPNTVHTPVHIQPTRSHNSAATAQDGTGMGGGGVEANSASSSWTVSLRVFPSIEVRGLEFPDSQTS